jgi:vitamin B12 transporter
VSANAAWRPSTNTTIRASYGEGFKAPTLFQLFSFFGNTTLNPETAKSYDVGVEQRLIDGALTVGVTAFLRNTGNQIDFISCFGRTTGICTNRPFGTYDNVKRSRAKGIEAFLRLRPAEGLTVEANYSYIDSKDRTTGLTLLRRPKHSVNASIDWDARAWLKLGASVQSVSDSFDSDFQTFSRTSLDGYALVGLRAAVPIGDHFEFYGRIENLLDTRYETVSGYGTLGRNAHVGVRAKF